MKVDRLIGIITILLQQDKITAPELAKRFEVSRRTINRDIEDICKAGIPLVTAQGFGGGISIADGYTIDKSLLTREELQAILTGLKGIDSVSSTSHSGRFLEKISGRNSRLTAEDTIVIDLASFYQRPLTEKIEVIKTAISEKNRISFDYYYEKGESRRTLEPYRLLFKWSSWYVWGYCPERQSFRLFKLNRLWNLKRETESFLPRELPPEESQPGRYLEKGTLHLKARFALSEKYRLIEEYGPECFTPDNSGRLLFEHDFASYANMREWVFSFGDRVEILEPQALAEDRIRQAENIMKGILEGLI